MRSVVHLLGNFFERDRHKWKWQQRDYGQSPVHAQKHHAQYHQQGRGAVKSGQHGFTGGKFYRIGIVGAERHQIAGALALKKIRALQTQSFV